MGAEAWTLDLDLTVDLGAGTLQVELRSRERSVAVFGPSGGGKSTLLRILAGVERGSRGRVLVRGEVWQDSERGVFLPPWQRRVGWVPQSYVLFPHLTVRRNLAFGGAEEGEVEETAERLGVAHLLQRRPRRLSGGEQQRVALGRALLAGPRVLLLDEPFSALDRPLRSRVGRELVGFSRERDVPVILVSHDEADAAALAGEHWLLSRGRVERVAVP
jgi:molybdate transport system ATP-binding protein